MKTVRFFVVGIFLISTFAITAFAQAAAPSKIAIIDTNSFYNSKTGIKKLAVEFQKLETEFKPVNDELQRLGTRINKLQTEIKAMQANKNVPINQSTLQLKATEYDKLTREFKFKEDDAKANYTRRQSELMQPVMSDIGKKIEAFAKQRNIDLVLDADKLVRSASLLYLNNSIDITKAFITYYNALPSGTATVKR